MARKINRFKLGLFFLIGMAITLGGLLWAGAAHFFQPAKTYVTFFKESVEGLNPGAAVSYLGVTVGRVNVIGIAPDGKLIRVELKLNPNFIPDSMAVELKLKGITGQLYLAIAPAPTDLSQVTPRITFPHKYPVIPSRPGEMVQITDALEKVYKKINSIDFKGLASAWEKTGKNANKLLTDKDIPRAIRNLREISADIKNLVSVLGKPGTPQKWRKSFGNLAATAAAARKTSEALAAQLEKLPVGVVGGLAQQMEQTIFQMDQVLTSLKGLVHKLREEPGKILVVPKGQEPFRR